MARDRDGDSASSSGGGQSERPALDHRKSDSHIDTSQHQQKHHKQPHQKHLHHVGRGTHSRVPSSKALHKQHGPPASKLTRRITSPPSELTATADAAAQASQRLSGAVAHSHRRATSEVKLPRASPAVNLPKSLSHTSLKRNKSHVDVGVGKRTKSSEKLKRTASATAIGRAKHAAKTSVHFDLGDDEPVEDEWVDASGSNSPYLSRKGSINGSAQSSAQANSRPETPNHHHDDSESPDEPAPPQQSSPERERLQHRQYLTSRLLQRTPSHGAPPQMTANLATGAPAQISPGSTDRDSSVMAGSSGVAGTGGDELTSRFVAQASSGVPSEGSFYQHQHARPVSRRSEDMARRPHSSVDLSRSHDHVESTPSTPLIEPDNSALVPRPGRRPAAQAADTSRIQQKLNLQRASSIVEPGQAVNGTTGVVGPGGALIGVGGPGYDGGNSRDPRVGKLLERTGMEYLVVRRYQNPIARSLRRLHRLPDTDRSKRIPRLNASTNGKRSMELNLPVRHTRNVSMPDPRRPQTPRPGGSVRANGAASSFDGDEDGRLAERLSGSSLVGGPEEDGAAALLRNLWDKSMDLSASTD